MKRHTELLLDKAKHAIQAAEVLRDADQIDFAAGRLYYAMLYVAEALLYERGLVFRKHSAVHAAYGKEFAKTELLDPKYHRWLLNAFDARVQGDYHVTTWLTRQDVEAGLRRAEEFLGAAREFLASAPGEAEG
ncbi:MAG: HEPN domain-containing protein [bacterium]